MRGIRLFFAAFFVIAGAAVVRAQIQIPVMDVSDPPCSEGQQCPSPVAAGMGFTFTTDSGGSGLFQGTNAFFGTGADTWGSLLFHLPASGIDPAKITCTSGVTTGHAPYASPCRAFFADDSHTTIGLLYSAFCGEFCSLPGIPSNDIFTISLKNFIAGTPFKAYPNEIIVGDDQLVELTSVSVPEPASFTLLAIGLGALLFKRKVKRLA